MQALPASESAHHRAKCRWNELRKIEMGQLPGPDSNLAELRPHWDSAGRHATSLEKRQSFRRGLDADKCFPRDTA